MVRVPVCDAMAWLLLCFHVFNIVALVELPLMDLKHFQRTLQHDTVTFPSMTPPPRLNVAKLADTCFSEWCLARIDSVFVGRDCSGSHKAILV